MLWVVLCVFFFVFHFSIWSCRFLQNDNTNHNQSCPFWNFSSHSIILQSSVEFGIKIAIKTMFHDSWCAFSWAMIVRSAVRSSVRLSVHLFTSYWSLVETQNISNQAVAWFMKIVVLLIAEEEQIVWWSQQLWCFSLKA